MIPEQVFDLRFPAVRYGAPPGSDGTVGGRTSAPMRHFAVVMLASLAALVLAPGAGAQAVPSMPPPPSLPPAPPQRCDVGLTVRPVDATRVALVFWTGGPSRVISGTVALYAGDRRYGVNFHGAFAREQDGSRGDAVPVIVRFPSPVTIDAAIPTSIDAPAQPVCLETLLPWVASKADAESFAADEDAFRAAVAGLPVQDAPPAVALPHECAVRNATAHVVTLQRSFVADGAGRTATVLVSLDIDDHVTDTRIILSSGASHIDKAALDAARRTRYATTVFNCTKLEADYVFTVSF